jgi:CheY-like chemotaxis protein
VLLLDESEDARELTATVLTRYGANVRVSATASDAKQMVENDQPDVVLASVGLGESDGYTLIRWLRADPVHSKAAVPAGALTGYVRVEDRTRALVAGFQILIRKPVEHAELVAAVAALAKLRLASSDSLYNGNASHG